ncbi:MAG: polynucleotide adenylyltransferase PcnB, partial [Syntrophaceae bacterium]|nr:polynucleotide adenylyltransferase PcnB [Syntrophaceae bacterium]
MKKSMQPRIIPRREHNISRRQISPNALRALYRLRDHGFIAYLVGGCVRDLILERTPKDFDIATDASPGQIKRLFRNCRLIGRRFRLAHLYFQDEILEVSTFRAAAPDEDPEMMEAETRETVEEAYHRRHPRHLKNEDGMVLRDNVFGTPEEDALRRDFTVNALAYNIADASIIDYTTGLSDLQQRLLRPIGDPFVRFTEDPVRMLRAVRFAASHELTIEPATWEVLCELAPTISRASPARLYEEMQKLFLLGAARPVFEGLERSGLLAPLFPGLYRWFSESGRHRDILTAHLAHLDEQHRSGIPPSALLFLAAFFGPVLETGALSHQREGMPRQQALETTCTSFLEELRRTVQVPARVAGRLRNILTMQTALHRMPPRRPATLVLRPEFAEAL